MKNKGGTVLIVLGTLCILSSLALFGYNRYEAAEADRFAQSALPALTEGITRRADESQTGAPATPSPKNAEPTPLPTPSPVPAMGTVTVDGYDYLGTLTIPTLELELPVMVDWSYEKLRMSPCYFTGSVYDKNLVLMAHNFDRHFGRISQLKPGDPVSFLDADGNRWDYEVSALDILNPMAIEEMTSGEWPLTLFTCSYGGKSRVTVRCDAVNTSYSGETYY